MKTLNKIKTILSLLLLVISVTPSMIYASDDTFTKDYRIGTTSTQKLTLDNAEIIIMMNYRGELYSSKMIHNLNNEEVFIITIKEDGFLRTYLIEQDESIELIEENKIG